MIDDIICEKTNGSDVSNVNLDGKSPRYSDIDKYTKERLYDIAFFEQVTNFYNWNWMRDKLQNFESYGIESFIFVHFDIKDFKVVNEIYGHETGDNLLRRVCSSMAMKEWVYFACRCDNDNFAMMIEPASEDVVRSRLKAMFDSMDCLEEDKTYPVFFRCGVADITDVKNYRVIITDLAKLAQGLGKKTNTTEINIYTDKMKEEQIKGKLMKSDLPRAIENNEFLVYYQPKFDPETNTIVGAEALVRWHYHHEELWSPGKFVPYLEKEGAIDVIDRFVFEEVCKKLEEWKNKGYKIVPISVNMSKSQLYNPNLVKRIVAIVEKYDIDRSFIEFELTESMAYEDEKYMLDIMHELRKLGFQLSIDDFGTGYSSLNLLSVMPLTTLKIDKSFIDEIGDAKDDGRVSFIVKDIVGMTKHLNIRSVAEGVETEAQKDIVREMGCDSIQGFYYSKPLPADEFEKLIK